jgi:hypothetical protein
MPRLCAISQSNHPSIGIYWLDIENSVNASTPETMGATKPPSTTNQIKFPRFAKLGSVPHFRRIRRIATPTSTALATEMIMALSQLSPAPIATTNPIAAHARICGMDALLQYRNNAATRKPFDIHNAEKSVSPRVNNSPAADKIPKAATIPVKMAMRLPTESGSLAAIFIRKPIYLSWKQGLQRNARSTPHLQDDIDQNRSNGLKPVIASLSFPSGNASMADWLKLFTELYWVICNWLRKRRF